MPGGGGRSFGKRLLPRMAKASGQRTSTNRHTLSDERL